MAHHCKFVGKILILKTISNLQESLADC